MHFHSLDSPLSAITTIIRMMVHVARLHLVHPTT